MSTVLEIIEAVKNLPDPFKFLRPKGSLASRAIQWGSSSRFAALLLTPLGTFNFAPFASFA
jgi:hypothetical protein